MFLNFTKACNDYLHAFCDKHDFYYEDCWWVSDQPGTIAMVGDYFVSMDTILVDINNDAPEEEFLKWYDYSLTCDDDYCMNFSTWLKKDKPKEVKIKQSTTMIEEFEKLLDDYGLTL